MYNLALIFTFHFSVKQTYQVPNMIGKNSSGYQEPKSNSILQPFSERQSLLPVSDFKNNSFETSFYLYIPETYGLVIDVIIQLGVGEKSLFSTNLTHHMNYSELWISEKIIIPKASRYSYTIRAKDPRYFVRKFQSIVLRKDYCEYSDGWNLVIEVPVQRNVFGEKNEKDIHNCYKLLMTDLIENIHCATSLKDCIVQFKSVWPTQLNLTSLGYELGWHMIQCAMERRDSTVNLEQAAFALYFLGYTSIYDRNFEPSWRKNIKMLLGSFENSSLQAILNQHMIKEVEDTIVWAFKGVSKSATILHFVYACYPMLCKEAIITNMNEFKPDCPNEEFATKVMQKLCGMIGQINGTNELIVEILKMIQSVEIYLFLFTCLESSGSQSLMNALKSNLYKMVEAEIERCMTANHLKNLDNLRLILEKKHSDIYVQLSETVSKRILYILRVDERSFTSADQVYTFIVSPQFVLDVNSWQLLFRIISSSKISSLHGLFPKFLKEERLMKHFHCDETVQFLQKWLYEEKPRNSLAECDLNHFNSLLQLSKSEVLDAKRDVIENTLRKKFCDNVSSIMQNFSLSKHIVEAETFLNQFRLLDGKAVEHLRNQFEETVLKIGNNCNNSWANEELEKLESIVCNDILFQDIDSAKKLLNWLANSHCFVIHALLPSVLKNDKFWKIIQPEHLKNVLSEWITTAKEWHCREKVRKNKISDLFENRLLYLYEYLSDIKQLSFPERFKQVSIDLEYQVRDECLKLAQHKQMDMMNNAKYIRHEAFFLLESHIGEAESNCSLTLKELEQKLKSMVENDKFFISSR